MKKNIFIISSLILIGLSSCKKSYSCQCTTTITAQGSPSENYPTTSKTYSEKMTEKQAKSACSHEETTVKTSIDDNINKVGAYGYITTNVSCTLK